MSPRTTSWPRVANTTMRRLVAVATTAIVIGQPP
jgi:hypothetical protein